MQEVRRSIITEFGGSVCKVISSGNSVVTGTGFFVATEGIVLTCNHVVSYFEVDSSGNIKLKYFPRIIVETSKSRVPAKVIHNISSTHPLFEDYAVLKADIKCFSPVRLGDYDLVEQGDDVLILGFPFGITELCATSGIVSAKHRSPSLFNSLIPLDMLRIDGSVNVGNSGGPLINLGSSSVVGIVSVRLGNISKYIERLRRRSDIPNDLLEVLEMSNRYLNVGIGEAISVSYASNELKQLGIKML